MMYVGNAFSLQMVSRDHLHRVRITPCAAPVKDGVEWVSCVGHADTAEILGVPMNRISVTLNPGDVLFVAHKDETGVRPGLSVVRSLMSLCRFITVIK